MKLNPGYNIPSTANTNKTTSTITGTTYSVTSSDQIIFINNGSAEVTITIPDSIVVNGKQITIKDISGSSSTYNITIVNGGVATIDGDASYIIASNYGSITLISNGTNWYII